MPHVHLGGSGSYRSFRGAHTGFGFGATLLRLSRGDLRAAQGSPGAVGLCARALLRQGDFDLGAPQVRGGYGYRRSLDHPAAAQAVWEGQEIAPSRAAVEATMGLVEAAIRAEAPPDAGDRCPHPADRQRDASTLGIPNQVQCLDCGWKRPGRVES